jgi:hypothetical protein
MVVEDEIQLCCGLAVRRNGVSVINIHPQAVSWLKAKTWVVPTRGKLMVWLQEWTGCWQEISAQEFTSVVLEGIKLFYRELWWKVEIHRWSDTTLLGVSITAYWNSFQRHVCGWNNFVSRCLRCSDLFQWGDVSKVVLIYLIIWDEHLTVHDACRSGWHILLEDLYVGSLPCLFLNC